MSIEHITVNGRELTAFDMPPEPSEAYTVHVDGLGEIVVEKGKPPSLNDVPAMCMRKLVPALCEQNAELMRENAKLRELVADIYEMAYYEYPSAFEMAFADRLRELGVEVDG